MLLDYAKNFKIKNIILRVISFVVYFLSSGFIGKLCVLLISPFCSLFLKQYPEMQNIISYVISVIFMLTAVSFFSFREGYSDTELLRFSYLKTIISYTTAGIIFYFLVLSAEILDAEYGDISALITEYFLMPYFLPPEISEIISNFIFSPEIPVLYEITENIKHFFLMKRVNLSLSVFLCVVFTIIFYKQGRNRWIAAKKRKIEQAQRRDKKIYM